MDTLLQKRDPDGLDDSSIMSFIEECVQGDGLSGLKVLCVVPDSTRSMPMPLVFRSICNALKNKVSRLDFLIALGTHPSMEDEEIQQWFGISREERESTYEQVGIFNHAWQDPGQLTSLGHVDGSTMHTLSDGKLSEPVDVQINKRVLDYDRILIFGPVFPHEVAGFSGGNKYFFPGIAGPEVLHQFHWLGALITSPEIMGKKHTPVRAVIDHCASLIPTATRACCFHITAKTCHGLYYGEVSEAWSEAADAAAETHIAYCEKPYEKVLAVCPAMYDELWVAGKCMYKLESVVADGGELIIYAPHLDEVSLTHGDLIKKIGYHVRDYFLENPDRFADIPGGILAHSSHVRGIGTMENGIEKPRITVTLATRISKEECNAINLSYRDPDSVRVKDWRGKESEGVLVVDRAGEILYHVK
jgi:nickel-dependent lactate racemase